MKELIKHNLSEAKKILQQFMNQQKNIDAIAEAASLMISAIEKGGKVVSCGNGGSMSDAMHFAEELSGRFKKDRPALPAVSISDPTHITCVANDYGFDQVFSRYIEALGNKGDILLAISTSGNSPNVINATQAALEKGMKVIALTGKSGGLLAELAHVELRVEGSEFSDRIQEVHIKIIHTFVELIEQGVLS